MTIAVLVLLLAASANAGFIYPNEIGLFTDLQDGPDFFKTQLGATGPGAYQAYLTCVNPFNEERGEPIRNLGGFELDVRVPADWIIESVEYPPNMMNFAGQPGSFFCSGIVPTGWTPDGTVPGCTVLATITFATFQESPRPDAFHLAPVYVSPSIPGHMAVTDADEDFALSRAFPISGGYDAPVMAVDYWVVDGEDAAWGDVKALYR
jgi:hypothetical protein